MNDVQIIGADAVAWQDYRALRLAALRDAPQAYGATYADNVAQPDTYWQTRLADAIEGRSNWLVFARADERLIGMVGAYQDDAMIAEQLAFVIAMFVTPAARGSGIARQLVEALLETLRLDPAMERVQLGCNAEQQEAVRLYERLGFVILERGRERLGDGKEHDFYLMERSLG